MHRIERIPTYARTFYSARYAVAVYAAVFHVAGSNGNIRMYSRIAIATHAHRDGIFGRSCFIIILYALEPYASILVRCITSSISLAVREEQQRNDIINREERTLCVCL